MTAFKYQYSNQIEQNIRALFVRVKQVVKMTITHEDFLSLFVPAEHRDMYRQMAVVAVSTRRRAEFKWGDTNLVFYVNELPGAFAPSIPRDTVLQHDAPAELVERITTWTKNGGNASVDFGRVMALFYELNKELTRAQIRFVWPSIMALCTGPVLEHISAELQDLKPSGAVPLPRGLLLACRKTAATIAMAGLIPADIEARPVGEVTIESQDGGAHEEVGLGNFMGLS